MNIFTDGDKIIKDVLGKLDNQSRLLTEILLLLQDQNRMLTADHHG